MADEAKACPTCCGEGGRITLCMGNRTVPTHDAPPQPAPSRDAKITDEWCAIAGKEDVVRLDRIHTRKATEGVQPAPRGCDHKFVDSNHCLKCGWVPPPVPEPAQPAPAGFDDDGCESADAVIIQHIHIGSAEYACGCSSCHQRDMRCVRLSEKVRAAHAKEVEEARQAACKWDHEHCPSCCKAMDESRAAGKREMARELLELIGPPGWYSPSMAILVDWLKARAGEENRV